MDRNLVRPPSNFRNTLFIALLLVATRAAAQKPGSISGTVTDASKARLPGVMVTLTSPALQTPEVTKVTDEGGAYQFAELPVGTYRIVFELAGFGQLVREGIQISTGFAARIDVTLSVAQLQETVTVSGQSPLVDVINTRGGATLSKDLLQNLPVTNNYQECPEPDARNRVRDSISCWKDRHRRRQHQLPNLRRGPRYHQQGARFRWIDSDHDD